jgi:hypothetical protein
VCEINGVSEETFSRRVDTVDTLEVFMTSAVDMGVFRYFPALRTVRVMKQPDVTAILGLEEARHLEALWVCECAVAHTKGLERCSGLEKLMLTSNRIQRLENLSPLTNLQTLWLNDNALTSLDGVECLVNLRELWACRNKIQRIGTSLNKCVSLRELNLADNAIGCFKEILNLCHLQSLESLALSDPHFGGNPVCGLCNYHTLVVFHLSQLTRLDMRQGGLRLMPSARLT